MQILKSTIEHKELPIKIHISFDKVYDYLEEQVADKSSVLHASAVTLLQELNQYPALREGFDDFSLLETYNVPIKKLLSLLFPDLLQTNEIKAASIPFDMTTFMLSKRFKKIIEDAGEDYLFDLRNFESNNMYILSCVYVLAIYYNTYIDFKRPFFFDIPDQHGVLKSYRAMFNADFANITKTEIAPEITEEDIHLLMNNFENVEVWKEKFPPNSYTFKGFGMMNLFDVTQDETISKIKNTFIKRDMDSFVQLEMLIQQLYNIKDLKLGISVYSKNEENKNSPLNFNDMSLISSGFCSCPGDHFCDGIVERVFSSSMITAITDIENYGERAGKNDFYNTIINNGIKSIILVPISLNDDFTAILEVGSPNAYQLNSINANKLKDIIPVLAITVERSIDERHNLLETIIQENYTTIHPSVKWKFYNAADDYISNENDLKKLKDIRFKNVYPIYGQCDVKGSSTARNNAIQEDLSYQLSQTISLFETIYAKENIAIYLQLIYCLQEKLDSIKDGIKTTDELQITDILKEEVYPILNHLKLTQPSLREKIKAYESEIDDRLGIVYQKRKAYEDFITHLNSSLAKHLDEAQNEVQRFYPHYYERFKTDGLDYNMYIGESITNAKKYHSLYIQNLRLWQLQQQCEMEYIARNIDVDHPEISLQVTSLILVHSLPLDIKFRMDEKKFDVDGAYNMRYEIIKKRIDKSYLKGTQERLTQAGKIAIVYTHEHDLQEYLTYIDYLTKLNYFVGEIEHVDIEDLQGVSGLKALRVNINFDKKNKDDLSFQKLLELTKLMD
ncbi:GAF domain-containing protein [Wenyingzhuangia sp. IMCC45574]